MNIEELLFQPESKTLEFKRDLSSLDHIVKTIVAFANTAGGVLIIGKAADGVVTGVQDVFKAEEALASAISDSIRPAILPEIEIVTYKQKSLLVIQVSHWKAPFYFKKEGPEKGVYIRLGSTCRMAGPELLAELKRSVINVSFDQQTLPDLSKKDLDFELIAKMFKGIKKQVDQIKLCSLGVLVKERNRLVPSIGGLILFGKKEKKDLLFPNAKVRCARFLGSEKVDILDRYDIEGSILEAVEEVPKFIARNTKLTSSIKSMHRKDIKEYPLIAIREVLINALVHADYSLSESDIQIAVFNNRLEIQNPGMFPFGFTLEDFKAGISRIRNRVIARVFYELGLMEQWGSGYKRIIASCKNKNYSEPKFEEMGMFVRVTFYPHDKTQIFKKASLTFLEKQKLREKFVLSILEKEKSIAFRDIYEKMKKTISERTLRYTLAKLKKKKLLISKGKGRSIIWMKI